MGSQYCSFLVKEVFSKPKNCRDLTPDVWHCKHETNQKALIGHKIPEFCCFYCSCCRVLLSSAVLFKSIFGFHMPFFALLQSFIQPYQLLPSQLKPGDQRLAKWNPIFYQVRAASYFYVLLHELSIWNAIIFYFEYFYRNVQCMLSIISNLTLTCINDKIFLLLWLCYTCIYPRMFDIKKLLNSFCLVRA